VPARANSGENSETTTALDHVQIERLRRSASLGFCCGVNYIILKMGYLCTGAPTTPGSRRLQLRPRAIGKRLAGSELMTIALDSAGLFAFILEGFPL
jgi:hypothetical protein